MSSVKSDNIIAVCCSMQMITLTEGTKRVINCETVKLSLGKLKKIDNTVKLGYNKHAWDWQNLFVITGIC